MRTVLFLAALLLALPAQAQNQGDFMAWNQCQQAKQACGLTALFVPQSATNAINEVVKARLAFDNCPDKYKSQFQAKMTAISTQLDVAARLHGDGDEFKAFADGAYGSISARVAAGNWTGVQKAATDCKNLYWAAIAKYNTATTTYGGAAGAARSLVYDIERFLSMIEAYEDFYGPIP